MLTGDTIKVRVEYLPAIVMRQHMARLDREFELADLNFRLQLSTRYNSDAMPAAFIIELIDTYAVHTADILTKGCQHAAV